ncbi:ABC transporter permease [Geomonas edaphica]|uniref:ABC transporter permease n=1 Tax=Geomonas edaphica TaxID=2570226 RepID=UPI0010A93C23|nr:ABC transporter permease [Geomonas edaphica]
MISLLTGAWRYRYFILSSIVTEFRSRFIRSRLGGLWMIINPLAQVAIFSFVLSGFMGAKLPGISTPFGYAIYLMAGTLGWSLFSEIVARCLTIFIDNGNLLKKLVFPKICLPLIVFGSALLNNFLLFMTMTVLFALLGHVPSTTVFWVPVLALLTAALAFGIGLILGVINVFIRDVGQAVPIILQLLYWFTPIVYLANVVDESHRIYLMMNPLYWIIEGFHNILLFGTNPNFKALAAIAFLDLILLLLAFVVLRRANADVVDAL